MCNLNPLPHAAAPTSAEPPLKLADFERPITSPAIYQQRIHDLEKAVRQSDLRREAAERENLQFRETIRGFERIVKSMAEAYDDLSAAFDRVTSRTGRQPETEQL
jgi:hypothetical protein